ncbi:type II toxin-antitoxin system VapC family toxin [Sphingomonas sp. RS2018]
MIVLDTHVLIWFIEADDRLGDRARERIERTATETGISIPAICAWEIALIERRDVLPFTGGSLAWFRRVLTLPNFAVVPLEPEIAVDSVGLDWSHKDPADRIIVATARHLRAPLLTVDRKILDFAVAGHVQAIDARR